MKSAHSSHHHPARHAPRPQQRLGHVQERWVYAAGAALALSGLGWLVCHYLLHPPGPGPHPLEVWWLRLHGLALILFLAVLGSVLPVHVRYGWRHHMNRVSGALVLGVAGLLALSGYGLYYLVDDDLREWTSIAHWIAGLAAIILLLTHVVLGKRRRR